jgi:hypothetical protein
MTKIAGSGSASESGSISTRHGSADPDPDPDPPQNVMDPQHWLPHYQLAAMAELLVPICPLYLQYVLQNC